MKFSIITPIYKTPEFKIQRLYNSLVNQTYSNWEWIVFDDSPTDYKDSYNYVSDLSKSDDRIKLYSDNKNCGIIGEVKRKAFYLGSGGFLLFCVKPENRKKLKLAMENQGLKYMNFKFDFEGVKVLANF